MKANRFLRDNGIVKCSRIVEDLSEQGVDSDFTKDLKRLIESHELVKDYYGLTKAKEHAESNYTAPEIKDALKQAIADVEACKEVYESN